MKGELYNMKTINLGLFFSKNTFYAITCLGVLLQWTKSSDCAFQLINENVLSLFHEWSILDLLVHFLYDGMCWCCPCCYYEQNTCLTLLLMLWLKMILQMNNLMFCKGNDDSKHMISKGREGREYYLWIHPLRPLLSLHQITFALFAP